MTKTEKLRKEVINYMAHADEKALLVFKSMIEDIEEQANSKGDWWDDVPAEIQAIIKKGMRVSEERKGISNEEMVKRSEGWLKS